jgi:hypothetical protein
VGCLLDEELLDLRLDMVSFARRCHRLSGMIDERGIPGDGDLFASKYQSSSQNRRFASLGKRNAAKARQFAVASGETLLTSCTFCLAGWCRGQCGLSFHVVTLRAAALKSGNPCVWSVAFPDD